MNIYQLLSKEDSGLKRSSAKKSSRGEELSLPESVILPTRDDDTFDTSQFYDVAFGPVKRQGSLGEEQAPSMASTCCSNSEAAASRNHFLQEESVTGTEDTTSRSTLYHSVASKSAIGAIESSVGAPSFVSAASTASSSEASSAVPSSESDESSSLEVPSPCYPTMNNKTRPSAATNRSDDKEQRRTAAYERYRQMQQQRRPNVDRRTKLNDKLHSWDQASTTSSISNSTEYENDVREREIDQLRIRIRNHLLAQQSEDENTNTDDDDETEDEVQAVRRARWEAFERITYEKKQAPHAV